MRKKRSPSKNLYIILVLLIFCVGYSIIRWNAPGPLEKKQQALATKLGIRIEDYPFPHSFPEGYFYTILKPGMTLSEVHEIIQGYQLVLRCGQRTEIYYYFNTKLEGDTVRFEILYANGHFFELRGEEVDSRTIQTVGCDEGLIEDK